MKVSCTHLNLQDRKRRAPFVFLVFIMQLLFLSSCGNVLKFSLNSKEGRTIKGIVPPLSGHISKRSHSSFYAYANSCEAKAFLYRINVIGTKESTPIASTELSAGATFTLEGGEEFHYNPNFPDYLIEIVGTGGGVCDFIYSRPVVGDLLHQTINWDTTLLSLTLSSNLPKKITQIPSSRIENLIKAMSNSNLDNSYNDLINNPEKRTLFENLFQGVPERLLEIPPSIKEITVPPVIDEEGTYSYSIQATHWKSNYDVLIKWKLNSVKVHSGGVDSPFIFKPHANQSGTHYLQAFIGKDDGTGEIDENFPYTLKEFTILVNNSVLPAPPSFELAETNLTALSSLPVWINTGTDKINCKSFSFFKFTINDASPPIAASIGQTCTSDETQTLNLALGADGPKEIRLWVRDNQNNVVGSAPIHIFKDTTNPLTTLSMSPISMKGGANATINYSASDNDQLSSIKLLYSLSGSAPYIEIADLSALGSSYTWSTPVADTVNGKLIIIAKDRIGRTHQSEVAFSLDSTAPVAPAISLNSDALTNSTTANFTVSSCSDRHQVYLSESASSPLPNAPGWYNCSENIGAMTYTLSSGDGVKTIYAFAQDAFGNVSGASSPVSVKLDMTPPPSPTIATLKPLTNSTTVSMTSSHCNDTTHIFVSETNIPPLHNAIGWQNCTTINGGVTHTLSNATNGNRTLYIFAKDGAKNISEIATSKTITLDTIPPQISSLVINDGAEYTGTPFVSLKISATDNLSPIKVHLVEADAVTGDCTTSYNFNNHWIDYISSSSPLSFAVSNSDGTKKICAWVKDSAGNEIEISDAHSGIIKFLVGNPPEITTFTALNPADGSTTYTSGNQNININWAVDAKLGLIENPIAISYSTDGTLYKDIVTDGDINDLSNITWIGGSATSGTYTSWTAPTTFFRLRLSVRDVAGNIGSPAYSNIQNAGRWSLYAGTTDRGVGGSGKSAVLKGLQAWSSMMAINPLNNDIYATDSGYGIRKLNAQTGIVETFAQHGALAILSGSPDSNGWYNLNSAPKVPSDGVQYIFDSNGYFYLFTSGTTNSSRVYQIDLSLKKVRVYLAGGTEISTPTLPASPQNAHVVSSAVTFDEENSLYFFVNCYPGTVISETGNAASHYLMQLAKAKQDPTTKKVTNIELVAGNCTTYGSIVNGADAMTARLPKVGYTTHNTITAWGNGKYIYVGSNNSGDYKILDGKIYTTNITGSAGLHYHSQSGKIYQSKTLIATWTPNLSGANGDVRDTAFYASSTGIGNCTADGTETSKACVSGNHNILQNSQGKIFFTDGSPINAYTPYRIRYVYEDPEDNKSKVKTIFGSLPLYAKDNNENPLDASLTRGIFGGIFYKKPDLGTSENLTTFPEGLYFGETTAVAFGYIDPITKKTSILWGNQSNSAIPSSGTTISEGVSMGKAYAYTNGRLVAFDSEGLPWIGANSALYTVDRNKSLNLEMGGGGTWEMAANGTLIKNLQVSVNGFSNNFEIGSNWLSFMLGAYSGVSYQPKSPVLKALNFSGTDAGDIRGGQIFRLMGDPTQTYASSPPKNSSEDPSLLTSRVLSKTCERSCYTRYDDKENILYYAEGANFRYIKNPDSLTTSTIHTLFSSSSAVGNFILNHDNSTLYYIRGGRLFCRNITSSRPECNDTTFLGPVTGAPTISSGPNQLTWKDDNTLLISTYTGYIYQYDLPIYND